MCRHIGQISSGMGLIETINVVKKNLPIEMTIGWCPNIVLLYKMLQFLFCIYHPIHNLHWR